MLIEAWEVDFSGNEEQDPGHGFGTSAPSYFAFGSLKNGFVGYGYLVIH
jgi:hypothetical protein